jgi:hypothetical protein
MAGRLRGRGSRQKVSLFYGQTLLDIVKCFERLGHKHIWKAARKRGYCLVTLRLSLAAYRMPRSVGVDGSYSRFIIASRGITAGSGFATHELRVLLMDPVEAANKAWPHVQITVYVDDFTLEVAHESRAVTAHMVAGATDLVVKYLEIDLECQLSEKKSISVASTFTLARQIAATSKSKKVTPQRSAKLLGTGSCGGRRRTMKVMKARLKAFDMRLPRMQHLRRSGVNAARIARAAGTPVLTYGVELTWLRGGASLELWHLLQEGSLPIWCYIQPMAQRALSILLSTPMYALCSTGQWRIGRIGRPA